jgi:hypothetical protein
VGRELDAATQRGGWTLMSERHKTHNGRDRSGNFRVKQADVEDKLEDPQGADFVRDDVRLGGAVGDTGAHAGERGERIEQLIRDNHEDTHSLTDDARREG